MYYIVDGIEFHISSFQYNISKSEAIITFNESEISRDFAQTKCIKLYVTDEFLARGWDNAEQAPNEYGLAVDELLNKLSHIAAAVETGEIK